MHLRKWLFADDSVAQKVGLLTLNLLLNTHQIKKADALVNLLHTRLNISPESFTSDEDDENDTRLNPFKEKSIKSLDYFKWMFRLYKIRTNVLNMKNFLIPNEEVNNTRFFFKYFVNFIKTYVADFRYIHFTSTSIL